MTPPPIEVGRLVIARRNFGGNTDGGRLGPGCTLPEGLGIGWKVHTID
jgi:hypothetical protein